MVHRGGFLGSNEAQMGVMYAVVILGILGVFIWLLVTKTEKFGMPATTNASHSGGAMCGAYGGGKGYYA